MYDSKGYVSEYKYRLIDDIAKVVEKSIVVVNGYLDEKAYERLNKKDNVELYIRQNEDYDAGAYKEVLLNEISFEELSQYKEIVMMNDTFYGPFVEWNEIFLYMNNLECDFWGISRAGGRDNIPEHIQAYFMVIKNKMFQDLLSFFKKHATFK